MNKDQLIEILQSCLLTFEGCRYDELEKTMTKENVSIGINLCKYLEENLKGEKR